LLAVDFPGGARARDWTAKRAPFFPKGIQNNGMNVPFCSFMYKLVLTIQSTNNEIPRPLPNLIQFSSIAAVFCTSFVRNVSAQQKDDGLTNCLLAFSGQEIAASAHHIEILQQLSSRAMPR
jgi:hypothetical protein